MYLNSLISKSEINNNQHISTTTTHFKPRENINMKERINQLNSLISPSSSSNQNNNQSSFYENNDYGNEKQIPPPPFNPSYNDSQSSLVPLPPPLVINISYDENGIPLPPPIPENLLKSPVSSTNSLSQKRNEEKGNTKIPPIFFEKEMSVHEKSIFPVKRMWWLVMTFLDLPELLSISQACKQFYWIAKDEQIWKTLYQKVHKDSQFFWGLEKLMKQKHKFDFSGVWKLKFKRYVIREFGSNKPVCIDCRKTFVWRIGFDDGSNCRINGNYHFKCNSCKDKKNFVTYPSTSIFGSLQELLNIKKNSNNQNRNNLILERPKEVVKTNVNMKEKINQLNSLISPSSSSNQNNNQSSSYENNDYRNEKQIPPPPFNPSYNDSQSSLVPLPPPLVINISYDENGIPLPPPIPENLLKSPVSSTNSLSQKRNEEKGNTKIPPIFFEKEMSVHEKSIFPVKRMWWLVMTFLDLPELLSISQACKQFYWIAKDEQIWKTLYQKVHKDSQFFWGLEKLMKQKHKFDFSGVWKLKFKRYVIREFGSNKPVCIDCRKTFVWRIGFDDGSINRSFKQFIFRCNNCRDKKIVNYHNPYSTNSGYNIPKTNQKKSFFDLFKRKK